jgi:type II secretory ATPase GspE/PulE/Tfp pilus assembly ATPase PilB-like protein
MMEEIRSFLPHAAEAARYRACGCAQCHGTGYAGSIAVYEVMPVSEGVRDLILEGRPPREIHALAVQQGMLTLRQAALLKVAQGRTTMEEVRRVVPDIPVAILDGTPTLAA